MGQRLVPVGFALYATAQAPTTEQRLIGLGTVALICQDTAILRELHLIQTALQMRAIVGISWRGVHGQDQALLGLSEVMTLVAILQLTAFLDPSSFLVYAWLECLV